MKKSISYIIVIAVFNVFLLSCSKSNTTIVAPLSATMVKDLPADTIIGITAQGQPYGAGKYTFYSLEKNSIIANTDSATTKWDLAFNGTKILTNSGTSGTGLGGAFVQVGLFDNLKTISADSVFKTDNAPSSYAVTFGSGKGWYTYDPIKNLITPLAGRVLVIRTASGKYAKVEIIAYYKGGVTLDATAPDAEKLSKQRYYTFRYIFQPNGTKTF
jgi:HmuY protein